MKQQKRFSTQEHVKIVFEIFKLVPYSHKTTAQSVQQQLIEKEIHRDIRTIQRNLKLLVSMGFVEQDSRSKPYGYQNISHQLSPLSSQEALIFQLAISHIQNLIPNSTIKILTGRIEDSKRALLSQTNHKKERQWLKKVFSEHSLYPLSVVGQSIIEKLSTAIYHNHWVHLNTMQTATFVYCMPLGLIQTSSDIQLIIGIEQSQILTIHSYSISDIQELKLSTFTFEYPEHFDLKSYLNTKRKTL